MTNIFNKMDISAQQMNLLEEAWGLSADLFADDLGTDGSILELDPDGGLKYQSAAQETFEDLHLADPLQDNFGEEWMETVDFQTLLNAGTGSAPVQTLVASPPLKVEKVEPKQEGMKQAAFDLLKALLTGQQPAKTELSFDLLQPAKPVETPAVLSPVAEVPNIDFTGCDNIDLLLGDVENTPVIHSFEDLIQPEISFDNDVAEFHTEVDNSDSYCNSDQNVIILEPTSFDDSLGSPITNTDVESILSSGPTSPSDISTIDTSYLSDTSESSAAKSIQVSSADFTKLKSKSKRGKAKYSPYEYDQDISDKKLRKKMQNKNAATRYREKKRSEKETLQEQEVRLSDKNKELREKVESLQREIQYMKELMNEINKAKRSKI